MSAAVLAPAFVALYASHQLGDHVFQTDRQAAGKAASKGWVGAMAGHLLGYGLCQLGALALVGLVGTPLSMTGIGVGVAISLVTHGVSDRRWPVRLLLEVTGSPKWATITAGGLNGMYLADQALHVGCLFGAALAVAVLS